jgi:hypothetical protein
MIDPGSEMIVNPSYYFEAASLHQTVNSEKKWEAQKS